MKDEDDGALMDQQTFEDTSAAGPASSVLFEEGASSVLFEAGAMDDSFDGGTGDDPFADAAASVADIYSNDDQESTIEMMYGRQVGAGLPRSYASSVLERCDDMDDRSPVLNPLVSGFRRDQETRLTTEVLGQTPVQQSEFYVAKQPVRTPFATVQVHRIIEY